MAAGVPAKEAWLRPARPIASSLFTRIMALALAIIVITQLMGLALLYLLPPAPPRIMALEAIAQAIATDNELLQAFDAPTPVEPDRTERNAALRLEQQLAEVLGIPADHVAINLADSQDGQMVLLSAGTAIPQYALVGDFEVAVRQPDSSWRHYGPRTRPAFDSRERRFLLLFLLSSLLVLPLVWWFARRLAEPIARLADSAEQTGRDPALPLPDITGPDEVERAARAIAGMQLRLSAFVEDRTAMLGAIAHDLRTPLTRLAFRAEKIAGADGVAIRRDLADMNAMVESSLAYVRGAHDAAGARRPIELGALVEQVTADLAMTGRTVSADIEGSAIVRGDPVSLARIITNLMENGAIHGGGAHARLSASDGTAIISIDDAGGGAENLDLERLFEPFVRGDPARGRRAGGSGLGLSVARSLARAHGGEVRLTYRPEGGIRATLELPLA